MFKFSTAFLLACAIFSTANAAPTSTKTEEIVQPPQSTQNKVYDSMIGTWEGKSNMNGKEMQQILKIRWALNHQFLIMDVKAISIENPKTNYEGMGIFGIDSQGKAKTWWFDNWGVDQMSMGSGVFSENKLELTNANANFKETRSFEISGKKMTMRAKGTTTWQGKETPFDQTTIYKKQ